MSVNVFAAALASAAFSILFNARGKNILLAAVGGGLGYWAYTGLPWDNVFAAAIMASTVLSLYAEITARIVKAPATIYLIPGLIPLVPGRDLFQSVLQALQGPAPGTEEFFNNALIKSGSLAVGILLVSTLIKLMPRLRPVGKKGKGLFHGSTKKNI